MTTPEPTNVASLDALLPALVRFARDSGVALEVLELRLGLTPGSLQDASVHTCAPWPGETVSGLLALLANELSEPALALRLPHALRFDRYPFAELSARASETVNAALEQLAASLGVLVPGIAGACVTEPGGALRFQLHDQPPRRRGPERLTHEYALALVLTIVRDESAAPIAAQRAWFASARPRDLAPLERFFGTQNLTFGEAASGFALHSTDAVRSLRRADARLRATLAPMTDLERSRATTPPRFDERVMTILARSLPDTSIDTIARALHVTPRTLQRRLDESSTRYSDLVDAVREQRARIALRDPQMPLATVAESLGFADVASFGRAFKRWTGTTPGAFRLSRRT